MRRLRDEGVVGAIGAGVNEWQVCQTLAERGDFDCFLLAGRYTLLEHEALQSFLPLCEQRNISVIIGGPYNTGILATGAVDDALLQLSAGAGRDQTAGRQDRSRVPRSPGAAGRRRAAVSAGPPGGGQRHTRRPQPGRDRTQPRTVSNACPGRVLAKPARRRPAADTGTAPRLN